MKRIAAVVFAVIIAVFSIVPAFAAKKDYISPTAPKEYTLEAIAKKGGTASKTITKDKDGRQIGTIIAEVKDGYKFTHWVIKGSYESIEGTQYNPEMQFVLKSDVIATAYFTPKGKPDDQDKRSSDTPVNPSPTPSQDGSPVSPKTGDSVTLFAFMGLIACVAVLAALGMKLGLSYKKK